jgi:DNA-binding NarL/FixJ family response regulator
MGGRHSILLLARSGQLLRSFEVLLRAAPGVEYLGHLVDGEVGDCLLPERRPDLILVDDPVLGIDANVSLAKITSSWSECRIIVLVDTFERKTAINATGSVLALLKGSEVQELFEAILNGDFENEEEAGQIE